VSLLRRSASAAPHDGTERKQKAEQRAKRMALARQARQASSTMRAPEPLYGIYVSVFMVGVGLVSYLSTDWGEIEKKVNGKVTYVHGLVQHPAQAVPLIALTLVAGASIYWRKRWVTGILFLMTAMIGLSTPLPKSLQDVTWAGFLVPAGYTMWIMILRLNKDQKDWIAKNGPARSDHGSPGNRKAQQSSTRNQVSRSRSHRAGTGPATGSAARPASTSSGRYTPPRAKSKGAQRKR